MLAPEKNRVPNIATCFQSMNAYQYVAVHDLVPWLTKFLPEYLEIHWLGSIHSKVLH